MKYYQNCLLVFASLIYCYSAHAIMGVESRKQDAASTQKQSKMIQAIDPKILKREITLQENIVKDLEAIFRQEVEIVSELEAFDGHISTKNLLKIAQRYFPNSLNPELQELCRGKLAKDAGAHKFQSCLEKEALNAFKRLDLYRVVKKNVYLKTIPSTASEISEAQKAYEKAHNSYVKKARIRIKRISDPEFSQAIDLTQWREQLDKLKSIHRLQESLLALSERKELAIPFNTVCNEEFRAGKYYEECEIAIDSHLETIANFRQEQGTDCNSIHLSSIASHACRKKMIRNVVKDYKLAKIYEHANQMLSEYNNYIINKRKVKDIREAIEQAKYLVHSDVIADLSIQLSDLKSSLAKGDFSKLPKATILELIPGLDRKKNNLISEQHAFKSEYEQSLADKIKDRDKNEAAYKKLRKDLDLTIKIEIAKIEFEIQEMHTVDLSLRNLEGKDISFLLYPNLLGASVNSSTRLPMYAWGEDFIRASTGVEEVQKTLASLIRTFNADFKIEADSYAYSHKEGLKRYNVSAILETMIHRKAARAALRDTEEMLLPIRIKELQ